jgi:hypothetical protein
VVAMNDVTPQLFSGDFAVAIPQPQDSRKGEVRYTVIAAYIRPRTASSRHTLVRPKSRAISQIGIPVFSTGRNRWTCSRAPTRRMPLHGRRCQRTR